MKKTTLTKEARELIRQLVLEVTIAGEVPTDTLYADYRPKDAMEYLGMKPKSDDAVGDGEEGGVPDDAEAEVHGPGKGSGAPFHDGQLTFDSDASDVGTEDTADSSSGQLSSATMSTKSAFEHIQYTERTRRRKLGL